MQEISLWLQHNPPIFIGSIFLLGLLIGSFLNVVIYRLPIMLEREWKQSCRELLGTDTPDEDNQQAPFNLSKPDSHCPHCKADVKWYDNIPVLSWLWLGRKCRHCKTPIPSRYPLIELLTAILSAVVAWKFGLGMACFYMLILTWALVALCFIDLDHQLLPDAITLPLLWIGLLASAMHLYTSPTEAILGAIGGYMSLWSIHHGYRLLTGKEGMGYGDFKLLAAMGAWAGWQLLPLIILLSSLTGAIIGVALIVFRNHGRNQPIPFGPYLAIAGWIALIQGDAIMHWYLDLMSGV